MANNIAIDGPAGAGKSTIAKIVAKKMGYIYVDTGAMYRAMALYLLRKDVDKNNQNAIELACEDADISIAYENDEQVVLLNGENVNGLIRSEEVGNMASVSSTNAKVRQKLVSLQQKLAKQKNVVMDGRDIGTVVLPDAACKIYLTASSKVRAVRRYNELIAKGESCDIDVIEADIIDRDNRDMSRSISPLKQAEDAILVDSSDMTVEEVAIKILEIAETKVNGSNCC